MGWLLARFFFFGPRLHGGTPFGYDQLLSRMQVGSELALPLTGTGRCFVCELVGPIGTDNLVLLLGGRSYWLSLEY